MRIFSLFLSVLILSAVMSAQKRYLVSPTDEVIPIDPQVGAAAAMKEWKQRMASSKNGVCSNKFHFGYDPAIYGLDANFGGYHKDVFGQWFTAKATGTIDTLFWSQWNAVNSYDSTVFLRIHQSYIGPTYGPGVRPGPFNPPCANWGYWKNTDDLDQGVAAFIEEATDTSWVSTINFSPVPSGPPFGAEIWGFGGFPVAVHAGETNFLDLSVLGAPTVTVGDRFFVSQRVAAPPTPTGHLEQTDEGRTEIGAVDFLVTTSDEDYPARNWKFYEHDKGPSNCGGTIPIDSIRRGWVARGGFTVDTLNTAVWNWWYAMTVSSNVPPQILDQTALDYSFDAGAKTVTATIEDCNPSGGPAGVASAVVRYAVDNGYPIDVSMSPLGGDVFEATIPAVPVGSSVAWKVLATDAQGATGQGPSDSYRIVPFGTEWFSVDTGYVCVPKDLSVSGTPIDTSAFFLPPLTNNIAPKDDGTAGPFDMGDDYVVFGDQFRWAWVGANGALALGKSALDTIDVNSDGYATTGFDFPYPQRQGRSDTLNRGRMPGMFIAPMFADLILGDSVGQYGRILHGNAGDTCLFIVQWDSIGAFSDAGPVVDITTFRAILNRCTGVVEYQYESVGTTGLDSAALIGMQADSNGVSGAEPGWVFVNRMGYPFETRPYDGYCVRMYPKVATVVNDGWNIVAVSLTPNDANYAKTALFPTAASAAFAYNSGYVGATTLAKGTGYWMKFSGDGGVGASPATFDNDVTATVADKWNLIGGPSGPVTTASIVATGGSVASSYYGYGPSGYYTALLVQPGQGYWVKMNGAGSLQMFSYGAAPKAAPMVVGETDLAVLNRVTITDATGRSQSLYIGNDGQLGNELSFYEMPPVPPAGSYDVRFASQRMVESYPDVQVDARTIDYPIAIQGAVYPVTVSWEMNSPVKGSRKMTFTDLVNGKSVQQVMEGAGSVVIKSENVKSVGIRISEGVNVPTTFAMSQNYPNPFNPVTHFKVDLPKATEVEVAVYDLLGRKIASLLSGNQAAGQYTLEWNGRDANGVGVPTGMYFLRLSSDEFNATQKIMLMK
jgi:hypothetical protein